MIERLMTLTRLASAFGRIDRQVDHPDGTPESDTTHSVHVAWLACSLARHYFPQLDEGLVAQFAMVHDAVEIYAGDVHAVTATADQRAKKKAREKSAAHLLASDLQFLPWLPGMVFRYEEQMEPEARFVKAVDKLAPKLMLRASKDAVAMMKSHGVTEEMAIEFRDRERKTMDAYASDFPEILALRDELNAMIDLGWLND